ncbi:hypothetical protein Scep_017023 [Stephania cephalantha]|uniref:Uncharacterized protein n=1 Tax=Stephania cephalantha TaxID=152367 RepID=A0AAP0NV88_9MAGN
MNSHSFEHKHIVRACAFSVHQPPQIDPADPPQQGDNVEQETQEWLTRDEHLGDT